MNLKDQVLSIDQVRELQELGFDIEKYASMCWIGVEDKYRLTIFDTWCLEKTCLGTIPTMTIGDIIEILPEKIYNHYSLEISKNYVDYCDDYISINREVEEKLIDSFFEMLKWCIKEKHIAL